MNGIIIVNKKSGPTSRDVVDEIQKILKIKAGHTGTLDPMAKGVLVICLGKATKLVSELTNTIKEYEAEIIFGIDTETLDIEGEIIKEKKAVIKKEKIEKVLNSFIKTYNQEVPKYSAIKIKGKRLYEYARNNIKVTLPKREVTIYDLKLLDYKQSNNKTTIKIYTKVSKGTYIRSLIRDISKNLNNVGVMSQLTRIKQGKFDIKNSYTINDIDEGKYEIISIKDALDLKVVKVNDELKFKIINGQKLKGNYEKVLFVDRDEKELAIYIKIDDELIVDKMLYEKT